MKFIQGVGNVNKVTISELKINRQNLAGYIYSGKEKKVIYNISNSNSNFYGRGWYFEQQN